jgi:arylformamidase
MPVHEISAPLRPDLPSWPGEGGLRREVVTDVSRGDSATVSRLSLGAHTGTHIDAPCHFLPGAPGVESLEPDVLVGPAVVAGLEHLTGPITATDLNAVGLPEGTERLLAKTTNSGWSARDTSFRKDFIAFDASGAQWCVDRGVRLVGIDYLSIEPFGSGRFGHPAHKALLGAGVVIVEGLDLAGVAPGRYLLSALPLLIPGGDGAPARAVLVD